MWLTISNTLLPPGICTVAAIRELGTSGMVYRFAELLQPQVWHADEIELDVSYGEWGESATDSCVHGFGKEFRSVEPVVNWGVPFVKWH